MNKKLTRAVIRQLGGRDYLEDVANHGASGGFPGFTYYSDTIAFFKRNRTEIIELVKEYSDEFGQGPISFVAGFNCLNDDPETRDEIGRAIYGRLQSGDTNVPNALAWFALEEVARAEIDQ